MIAAIRRFFRERRINSQIIECHRRAAQLAAWGDPESARDQLDMAQALREQLQKR